MRWKLCHCVSIPPIKYPTLSPVTDNPVEERSRDRSPAPSLRGARTARWLARLGHHRHDHLLADRKEREAYIEIANEAY